MLRGERLWSDCLVEPSKMPDWAKQEHRFYAPCIADPDWHWRRECTCTTLGGIFALLGTEYDAALLYYFYRTRRVVCVKMRPGKGKR